MHHSWNITYIKQWNQIIQTNKQTNKPIQWMFNKSIWLIKSFEKAAFYCFDMIRQGVLQIRTLHKTLLASKLYESNFSLCNYNVYFLYVWLTRYWAGKIGSKYESTLITIGPSS